MFIKSRENRVKKGIGKIVHDLWTEKGMWGINEKILMNQIRMIKSKGWVKNRNRNNQEKNRIRK